MPYYPRHKLEKMGFKSLGRNVKISDRASIYNCHQIEIGSDSRIDDFCVISGKVKIGRNVHITPMCLVAGGLPGVIISDFATIAYGSKIFAQSDDYSGGSMTNSTIPKKYKKEYKKKVVIGRHSIIGAGSVIMPGVNVLEGGAIGSMSLVLKSTESWTVYAGIPIKKLKSRKKDILDFEQKFLKKIRCKFQ